MTAPVSFTEIITGIIAIYGAVLSTVIFTKGQQNTKRKVQIKMTDGFLTYEDGISDPMLILQIINPGWKTVTINGPQLRLIDGKNLILSIHKSNVKFPHELGEGKNAIVWIEIKELKESLISIGYYGSIKVRAVVMDQTGKEFFCRKWKEIRLN